MVIRGVWRTSAGGWCVCVGVWQTGAGGASGELSRVGITESVLEGEIELSDRLIGLLGL
jgi:hypothetical protein